MSSCKEPVARKTHTNTNINTNNTNNTMYVEKKARKRNLKRSRWVTSAVVCLAAILVDIDNTLAFSPAANSLSPSLGPDDGRRSNKVNGPNDEVRKGGRSTDLNVAVSTLPSSGMEPVSDKVTRRQQQQQKEITSLSSSNRIVSVGKPGRGPRLMRSKKSSKHHNGSVAETRPSKKETRNGLLTKEEERTMTYKIRSLRRAVRIRDELVEVTQATPSEEEWADACGLSVLDLRLVMHEGQHARSVLVSANEGLVTSIAKRYFVPLIRATQAGGGVGTILSLQDLVQEGNLGLMKAAERFEPERELRFSTYATYWIRQRILRSISYYSRPIRLPAHVHAMLQKLQKAKKAVMNEIGREPSLPELAHYMEMNVDELRKLTTRSKNVVSLEAPLRSGGSLKEDRRTIGDFIVSDAPTPEEDAQRRYLKQDIRTVVNELADRERDVLILRFGLENGGPLSVSQTAKALGITDDRVRLVEARALNKLRSPQRNYRLKEYVRGHTDTDTHQTVEEAGPSPEKLWFF